MVSWLRSRTDGTFGDSVGTFRRHLTVLERATPTTVVPANRLRSDSVTGAAIPPYRSGLTAFRDRPPAAQIPGSFATARAAGPGGSLARRRRAQKRRRDVLLALLGGAFASFVLAMVPGLSVLWSVQVLFDVLAALYVGLLLRLRNASAEREIDLRVMESRPGPRATPYYDFGASGYGELDLRRVAN